MNIRIFRGLLAMAAVFATTSMADIIGSTYNFTTSDTGSTVISPLGGPTSHTAPANPGFCVGSTSVGPACAASSGVSGSFTFSEVNPTLAQITFNFAGSTAGAGPGSFSIDLGHFVLLDGDRITNASYASGSLFGASSSASWNGTDATFTFTTGSDFNAIGGTSVVFNVAEAATPEPSSILLLGSALGLLAGVRKLRLLNS